MGTTYSKEDIILEYNQSAELEEDFMKVKWGSTQSMINRYFLALDELPFSKSTSWLDVGCGTGSFQAITLERYPHIVGLGIDLNAKLIRFALEKQIMGIEFRVGDFMEVKNVKYDLITCLGVIQKANFTLQQFFQHVSELLKHNGMLLVDTKNIGWYKFHDPGYTPEPIHQWFSVKEIRNVLETSELKEIKLSGFLPSENKLVAPDASHTIFLIAQKI